MREIEWNINKVYAPLFKYEKRFNFLYGGAGSAKSHDGTCSKINKIMVYPYAKEVFLRKNYVSIKDSCYALIGKIITDIGINYAFDFTTSPLHVVYRKTGNEILFRGMKDTADREKLKSIVDPTGMTFEEASEFEREDFIQANLRVRGNNNTPKQLDLFWNPIDEDHWLKTDILDKNYKKENSLVIRTTYHDNRFLDAENIAELELLKEEDYNLYKIYCLGEHGTFNKRGNIYKHFSDANVIESCKVDNDKPLMLAMDFNVDPMKWAVGQEQKDLSDVFFAEVVQADTTTERMCEEVVRRFGLNTRYDVYGDYSGTHRHTSSVSTDYDIIKQMLPNSRIFVKNNPLIVDRINAVNNRLCNQAGVRKLFFTKACVNCIADMKRVKFVEGKREEDKSQEKYDGRNVVNALVHMSSAVGYCVEYRHGLRGKTKVYTNL